jgi:type II secretory pathway component PulF
VFVFPRTKWIGESFLFAIPGVRQLIQEVELARLGILLGGLLRGGVPILPALDSLRSATQSDRYRALYLHLRERIEDGDSLEQGFKSFKSIGGLIPEPIQQLIIVGSRTGKLADVLLKTGSVYEEKSDMSTKNLSVILEPILLFIVWLAVVGVAIGVILPIYNLIGGIHK